MPTATDPTAAAAEERTSEKASRMFKLEQKVRRGANKRQSPGRPERRETDTQPHTHERVRANPTNPLPLGKVTECAVCVYHRKTV